MFLGTTALSEFWDREQEILFLGTWCLRYDRKEEWESLRYQILPCPWDDRERFYQAARYLDKCGEWMLNNLTDYLNSVHNVSHSQRYWRILTGVWLSHYLHMAYDRYVHLNEAFSRHADLQTVVLDPQSFRVPKDTMELVGFISDDAYNLQIFSQLLQGMGYFFPTQTLQNGWPEASKADESGGLFRAVKNLGRGGIRLVENAMSRAVDRNGHVALCDVYFSRVKVQALAWGSGLRVVFLEMKNNWSFSLPGAIFDERRRGLAALPSSSEFERLFVQSIPVNFPILYLEGYQSARSNLLERYCQIAPVIASGTGWYFNEAFKFLAAEASERGSRLLTAQHGGGYGIFRFAPAELHESRVGDSFTVWGWAEDGGSSRNLPSPKFSSLLCRKFRKPNSSRDATILFVATAQPRYLYRFHSTPVGSQWRDYFAWQIRFLAAASGPIRPTIIFRPNSIDYAHAVRERIAEEFAEVQWDDGKPFYQRLRRSRMVVVDHPVTTFLESLVANVPTVLFWDPQRWEVRDEAEPYFESLRRVGILWDSPETAAAKVREIYNQPWTWWASEVVQEVRKRFVERYALAREDWVDWWVRALDEEIALSQARDK